MRKLHYAIKKFSFALKRNLTSLKTPSKDFKAILYGLKKLIVVYVPIAAFFLFIIYWTTSNLLNKNKDTTTFLSVGFAMLIGLSSVCFSWFKTLDESDTKSKKIIRTAGESFFISAVTLIIFTALKYSSFILSSSKNHTLETLGSICFWFGNILLLSILNFLGVGISALLNLLFTRVDNEISDL